MQCHYGGAGASRQPSAWILFLLLLAFLGLSLVHDPEPDEAGTGQPKVSGSAARPDHALRTGTVQPEGRKPGQGEVRKDGGP